MVADGLVVALDGQVPDRRPLGGKAAALDRLIGLGHPVPAAAVLTVEAYRLAAASPTVAELVDRLRAGRRSPAADDVPDDAIDRVFLDATLPRPVVDAIDQLRRAVRHPMALRSSATAEDLSTSAFAGQYRTFLGVGDDDVELAVRSIWASLWHLAPRRYRARRGIGDDGIGMAVLAMEMVDAATSGVLFTCDPTGSADDVHLEVVTGLGEALVSGAVTPEVFVWPRRTAVDEAAAVGAAHAEVVRRSLEVERSLGAPQDVEFSIDRRGVLWLLQARPITTAPAADLAGPADDPHDDDRQDDRHEDDMAGGTTLTTAGIAEMLPGPLPPLIWETAGAAVEHGFRCLFDDLGASLGDLPEPHRIVRRVHARAAVDADALRELVSRVPGGSVAELERGYDLAPTESHRRGAGSPTVQALRILQRRRQAVLEAEIVVRAIDRLAADEPGLDAVGDDALLALRRRAADLGVRATAAEIAIAALAAAAYRGVETTLETHVGPRASTAITQRLTTPERDGGGTWFARDVPALPTELDRVAPLGWPEAQRVLAADVAGRRFLDAWQHALDHSDSMSVFGGPTWADRPDLAWMVHAGAAGRRGEPGSTSKRLRGELDRVPHRTGRTLWAARRRFLIREIDDAAALLERREEGKRAVLRLGGFVRRIDDAIGARLVERRLVGCVDDVRLLRPGELARALDGDAPSSATLVRRRAVVERATASWDPRPARGARPGAGGEHVGWAASAGRHTGPAVVVGEPRATAIRPGEVLVAWHTDASWSPLFAVAGAIVVEEGGPLSHAAIIARELGVPAVVNVAGIVDCVRRAGPGAVVTVDGSDGIVRVERPAATAPIRRPPDGSLLTRSHVFVTGLIGASALLGAVVSATQAVSGERGRRRIRRRADVPAELTARAVIDGHASVARSPIGLRPAWAYLVGAAVAALVAVSMLLAGLRGYASSAATTRPVPLALALLTGVSTGAAALVAASSWSTWPAVPGAVRALTRRSRPPGRVARTLWTEAPALHRRLLGLSTGTALMLLLLVVVARDALTSVDRRLYRAIGAPHPETWGPDWFGMWFGRPQVVVPAALVVALFTIRCRVLALAYPLAIVAGGLLNLGLGWAVGRDRPPLGAHADQTDSFPSGHAIEVTLLLGLAPLAIAVLTRSRAVGIAARVVASAVLAVMLADGLRAGSHWPSDHLAGFAIAATVVVAIDALAATPELHRSCRRCPTHALVHEAAEGVAPP